MDTKALALEWKKYVLKNQENKKRGQKKLMRSLHLDPRMRFSSEEDPQFDKILNPKKVAHHAFYPFLEFTKIVPRYKKNGDERETQDKRRELCFASHADLLLYSWYARLLGERYEGYLKGKPYASSILAYRSVPIEGEEEGEAQKGKSNIHFANEVFDTIRKMGKCTVLTFDVIDFFPSISHENLKQAWAKILGVKLLPEDQYAIFYSLTRYAFVRLEDLLEAFGKGGKHKRFTGKRKYQRICSPEEFQEFKKRRFNDAEGVGVHKGVQRNAKKRGIPQGSAMSGLLSNIAMLEFDETVYEEVRSLGGHYWRYSDDIVIILPKDVEKQKRIEELVADAAKKEGLELHDDGKSEKVHFVLTEAGYLRSDKPLEYLGFSFDGRYVRLRNKTLARFFRTMSNHVKREIWRAQHYKSKVNFKKLRRKFSRTESGSTRRTFLTYADRAAGEIKGSVIDQQISRAEKILNKKIERRKRRYKFFN